ncbi:hypothetical protein Tco_1575583 [Tanacetum coccineum]
MPIKLGSFDIVIGMDWLSKYHARIICDEKVVHIPIDGETLIIRECITISELNKLTYKNRLPITRSMDFIQPNFKVQVFTQRLDFNPSYHQLKSGRKDSKTAFRTRHMINSQGIHVDLAKIEAVKNWASLTTPTEVRQFLGLAGYCRRFINDFSKIAKSLTEN